MPTVAMSMVENKQLWGIASQSEEKLKKVVIKREQINKPVSSSLAAQ